MSTTTQSNEKAGMPVAMSQLNLRDYFAAKALPVVWRDIPEDANRLQALSYLGIRSYEMADAMLAARERT